MADQGFPVGGHGPDRGHVDPLEGCGCVHFSVKMHAKMKELGPIGGHAPGMPP